MRRLAVALTIVGGLTLAGAAPAFAGGSCYPPPQECEWRPGFGGLANRFCSRPENEKAAPEGGLPCSGGIAWRQ